MSSFSRRNASVRLRQFCLGMLTAGVFATGLVAPGTANGAVEVFADIQRVGDSERWKGWAVDANPSQVFSWRIRLYGSGGDFSGVILEEHTKSNFGGSTYFSTPSYTTWNNWPRMCVWFYLYRKATPTGTPAKKAHDCVG
jgi:hypothetical protein